jgi:hypothetical protein
MKVEPKIRDCEDVQWMELAQGCVQCRLLMFAVLNFEFYYQTFIGLLVAFTKTSICMMFTHPVIGCLHIYIQTSI